MELNGKKQKPVIAGPFDIAIIGMACVFPGAADLDQYWANILNGVNSITEVPRDRWNPDLYYDPNGRPGDKTPSKWGGFLPDVAFDPLSFGIPPRSLAAIEPVQLLSLEVARRALDDAGYLDQEFNHERTSVIFGAEAGTELANAYGFRAFFPKFAGPLPSALNQALPSLTEDSFPGVLANVIAGRIANRLNLCGANYTVDAACASSLAAVDLACKELIMGSSDMVVCGGADLHNSIADYLLFASVHALSPTGQCRTFDANADGIVLGEGVGVVVLKRLADAEQDRDRIYAVIKGVGSSSDGRSLGLTAPRKEGQVLAIERAFEAARVTAAEIGLVEAHGTGTVVGDATELATLNDVFTRAGATPRSCRLGSVKSQIGHTKCAAGMAGLLKVALALHRSVLPPTFNIQRPNPSYDSAQSPFAFSSTAHPWTSEKRKAGISAFGFGGTNFHAVLTAPDARGLPASGIDEWPAELFLFRGNNRDEALAAVARVERFVTEVWQCRLRDLAYSVSMTNELPVQIAVVASSLDDLQTKLHRLRMADEANSLSHEKEIFFANPLRGSLAFVFPGQGSQRPGMLSEIFVAFPHLQRYLRMGSRWQAFLFPPASFSAEERKSQSEAITDTRIAQPTLGMASLALADLLHTLGVREHMLGGHSYGELAALCAAGAIPESAVLDLSEARGRCIQEAARGDAGGMAAVSGSASKVVEVIADFPEVVVANRNAPDQQVIAGPSKPLALAIERLESAGISAHRIPVACAFHSPVIAAAGASFARILDDVEISQPRVPVWSNLNASCYQPDAGTIRKQLADHLVNPVLFHNQVEAMYEAGARVFVEVGPGRVLTGLISRILDGKPHVALACEQPGQSAIRQLLLTLAQLAVCDVALETIKLFADRKPRKLNLDQPESPSPNTWMINGHYARPLQGDLPEFGMRPMTEPVRWAAPPDREAAISDYLRNMREMAQAQRDVMLRFLGTEAPSAELFPSEKNESRTPSLQQPESANTKVVETRLAKDVVTELLQAVSRQTGYPVEALDLDLDIEADLSIDSIKRVEIIGAVSERLGLRDRNDTDADKAIEQLAGIKTLRSMAAWLEKLKQHAEDMEEPLPPLTPLIPFIIDEPAESAHPAFARSGLRRFSFDLERTPAARMNGYSLRGRRFIFTEDSLGVSEALRKLLERDGASTAIAGVGSVDLPADGLIHLASLSAESSASSINALFDLARRIVPGGATHLLAATAFGGVFGQNGGQLRVGGISGFVKSVAKEWPSLHARVVDLDPAEGTERLAGHLYAELLADDDLVEVGYTSGIRQVVRISSASLPDHNVKEVDLGRDSVVLLTGGARGITADISIALAERWGCRLELVGRSPIPEDELPAWDSARSLPELRQAILAQGVLKEPSLIESSAREILAAREIRETLRAIRRTGSRVTYHSTDVSNSAGFEALIEDIYSRFGRIDGVIHGAGIIEDKLLSHKSADSFQKVFETKVRPALTLARKLRADAKFVIFFSSVAGIFGNRGQADYAAASEALDKLAHSLAGRIEGRVVSIDWGPWEGTGMVSPELQNVYSRRGIHSISRKAGVNAFIDELSKGDKSDVQVAWLGSDAEAFR